jgi:hypothetical protein
MWVNKANLNKANLDSADFSHANLSEANLTEANLHWTELTSANLSEANLESVIGLKFPPQNKEMITQIARILVEDSLGMDRWKFSCGDCIYCWCNALHDQDYTKQPGTRINDYAIASYVLGEEARSHFFDTNQQVLEYLKTKL